MQVNNGRMPSLFTAWGVAIRNFRELIDLVDSFQAYDRKFLLINLGLALVLSEQASVNKELELKPIKMLTQYVAMWMNDTKSRRPSSKRRLERAFQQLAVVGYWFSPFRLSCSENWSPYG